MPDQTDQTVWVTSDSLAAATFVTASDAGYDNPDEYLKPRHAESSAEDSGRLCLL